MTSPTTRKVMQANKGKDTIPELQVRMLLRMLGYPGYRLQWKKAPGCPDIAYPGRKIAIFVNGCFWHHHNGCDFARIPKSNVAFWKEKFEKNTKRDQQTRETLEDDGWAVVTVWECELRKDKIEGTKKYLYSILSI